MKMKYLLVPVALGLLAGCSNVRTTIKASPEVNTDVQGRPSPMAVKVFELTSQSAFTSAGFDDLFNNSQATLGSALLASKEVIMTPGSTQEVSLPMKKTAKYVGVAAGFRNIDSVTWKQIQPIGGNVQQYLGHSVNVHLGKNGLTLS
jgi:type VI secretion system protein VasD